MSLLTPENALIFRITHFENVPWILRNGLHCRSSRKLDPHFLQIGNRDLIESRADRAIPIPPRGTISDYIPFYFTPYTPMLLNIKTGYNGVPKLPMREIAILQTSLHTVIEHEIPFVFTDRHAKLETAQFYRDLDDLAHIPWEHLQNRDFKRDPKIFDKVERYQAESLIYGSLPVEAIERIGCREAAQKERLERVAEDAGVDVRILAKPGWYV
jgi:hypothetical protein